MKFSNFLAFRSGSGGEMQQKRQKKNIHSKYLARRNPSDKHSLTCLTTKLPQFLPNLSYRHHNDTTTTPGYPERKFLPPCGRLIRGTASFIDIARRAVTTDYLSSRANERCKLISLFFSFFVFYLPSFSVAFGASSVH